jgi:NADH-quinone oxidoreductase subunit N
LAFFLLFFRLVFNTFYGILFQFQPFFLISSLCSISVGVFGAYYQTRIKRFIAYTSITQAGYILVGISCCTLNGLLSSFFYLILYILVSLGFFLLLINFNHILYQNNPVFMNDFLNVFRYNKYSSFYLGFIFLSMATFPPITTFYSKVYIYICLFECKFDILAFIIMTFNVISAVYYLRFVQDLFFFKDAYGGKNRFFIFTVNHSLIIILKLILVSLLFPIFFCSFFFDFSLNLMISCM